MTAEEGEKCQLPTSWKDALVDVINEQVSSIEPPNTHIYELIPAVRALSKSSILAKTHIYTCEYVCVHVYAKKKEEESQGKLVKAIKRRKSQAPIKDRRKVRKKAVTFAIGWTADDFDDAVFNIFTKNQKLFLSTTAGDH